MPGTSTSRVGGRQGTALKLWIVLARAHAAVAEHARAHAATHGLTLQEFGIMEALHHKGDLLLGELQDKILVTSGGVTYLVDRLVEKGMVERRECTEDRRARYASLTGRGRALMERIFPEHAEWLSTALGGLSVTDQKEAARLLKALGTHASKTPPGPDF